jgi:hypothetical protein
MEAQRLYWTQARKQEIGIRSLIRDLIEQFQRFAIA